MNQWRKIKVNQRRQVCKKKLLDKIMISETVLCNNRVKVKIEIQNG
jgi:hypothetical protein